MSRPTRAAIGAAAMAVLFLAAAATAAAPSPRKPFDAGRMAGRWYEVARTPSSFNRDCQASLTEWKALGGGKFSVSAVCHKGSPGGKVTTRGGTVRILNPGANNKVKMTFLGGLASQEYWLLDRADDYSWLIMGTPGGNYISISTRGSAGGKAVRDQAIARARALGYDTGKLVIVQH